MVELRKGAVEIRNRQPLKKRHFTRCRNFFLVLRRKLGIPQKRMSAKPHLIVKWLLLFLLFDSSALGEYRDAVGWYELVEEVGAETPDGTGIKVSLIESAVIRNYLPDRSNFDFIGKTFTVMSGDSGHSSHATVVGQRLFGNTISMAGGIDQIGRRCCSENLSCVFLQ